tara:strand:+ start:732 stop:995 length:264 start_codon:yes stop_codon:yes gene_type:complete
MKLKKDLLPKPKRLDNIRKAVEKIQGKALPEPDTESQRFEVDTDTDHPTMLRLKGDLTSEVAERVLKSHRGFCQGSILETCDGNEIE